MPQMQNKHQRVKYHPQHLSSPKLKTNETCNRSKLIFKYFAFFFLPSKWFCLTNDYDNHSSMIDATINKKKKTLLYKFRDELLSF
jgi:hypothetical protein